MLEKEKRTGDATLALTDVPWMTTIVSIVISNSTSIAFTYHGV